MLTYSDVIRNSLNKYEGFIRELHRISSTVEKEGYCARSRVHEVKELASKLGIKKLGIAFCIGLSNEAKAIVKYFEDDGFEVYSVCCKCGGVDKMWIGLSEDQKLIPGSHESMCNPLTQAELLNHVGTELNVVVGLCVGHDAF